MCGKGEALLEIDPCAFYNNSGHGRNLVGDGGGGMSPPPQLFNKGGHTIFYPPHILVMVPTAPPPPPTHTHIAIGNCVTDSGYAPGVCHAAVSAKHRVNQGKTAVSATYINICKLHLLQS